MDYLDGHQRKTTSAISASIGPTDVAVDPSGNLLIADFDNYRIRKVTYVPPVRKVRGQITSQ
jgi:DNA-binding beta-propeller fold protein YncE